MKAFELKTGDKVNGQYYGQKFSGTVKHSRFHSCRNDLVEIAVTLSAPINVFGELRDRIIVNCGVEDGMQVKGWGDNSITL